MDINQFSRTSYESDTFYIRPISINDVELLYQWRTDANINRYLYSPPPKSLDEQISWYKRNQQCPEDMYYMVFHKRDLSLPLGYCQLVKIDKHEKAAETGLVIDNKRSSSGIINIELGMAMLAIAFNFLEVDQVYSSVNTENHPSRHFFESLINSQITDDPHPYRKRGEILYKTSRQQFTEKLIELLNKKSSRWRHALNLRIYNGT